MARKQDHSKSLAKKKRGGKMPGSGRPPGRGVIVPIKDKKLFGVKCREYSEEALELILSIMRDPKMDPRLRVDQAWQLIGYGYGKPAQSHEVHGLIEKQVGITITDERFKAFPLEVQKAIVLELEHEASSDGPTRGEGTNPRPLALTDRRTGKGRSS